MVIKVKLKILKTFMYSLYILYVKYRAQATVNVMNYFSASLSLVQALGHCRLCVNLQLLQQTAVFSMLKSDACHVVVC